MDFLRKIIVLVALIGATDLKSQSYPLITSGGGIEEWKTSTNYVVDEIVWQQEDFYKALTVHTSGVFATDLLNNEWARMSDDLDKIGTSTDNAITRWDGVDGSAVQDSGVTISDTGDVVGINTLSIGAGVVAPSSILDIFSTTAGSKPFPSMTTAQRDFILGPINGLTIYNTDTNQANIFNGTTWGAVGAGVSAWQAAFVYQTGDVIYNGGDTRFPIYRADSNFTSGGTFAPSNWTELSQHVNAIPSSTDETLLRWDGVNGDTIQQSGVVLTDTSAMSGLTSLTVDNIFVDGNTVSSLSGPIILSPTTQVNLPLLTASQPAYIDASGNLISQDLDLTTDMSGVLPIANGGTNSSAVLNNNRNIVSVGGSLVEQSARLAGSIFFGDVGGLPEEDNANLFWGDTDNTLLIGDNTVDSSASFEVTSTTKGIFLPRMTTVQRDAITVDAARDGLAIYDTTVAKFSYYNAITSAWSYLGGMVLSSSTLATAEYTEIELPHDQLTVTDITTGLEKVRIETGNDSWLSNGSFEHSDYSNGWVIFGTGTPSEETTEVFEGGKSFRLTTAGGTQSIELSQTKTFTQYEGNTVGATCMIKSNSARVKLCVGNAVGSNDCVYHDGSDQWRQLQAIMMVDATGETFLHISTDDNEDAIVFVDSCKWSNDPLKIKNVNNMTDWVSYVPTVTGITATSAENIMYRRVGDSYEIRGVLTVDGVDASEVRISLPVNGVVAASVTNTSSAGTYFRGSVTPASGGTILIIGGDNFFNISSANVFNSVSLNALTTSTGSAEFGIGDEFSFSTTIPIQGFTSNNSEIITAADIVSSETMNFQFKATAITSSDPVGTYNTFDYPSNGTNERLICATPPLVLPNNLDGLRFYSEPVMDRSFGTCNNPSFYTVKTPQNLKGVSANLWESPSRVGGLFEDSQNTGAAKSGIQEISIDTVLGSISFSAGVDVEGTTTSSTFLRKDVLDGSSVTNGYLHFHASRNPVVNGISLGVAVERPTCFIKDVKPSGTGGGVFISGDPDGAGPNFGYVRDLNTLSGSCVGISLTSNIVTVSLAGTYIARWCGLARIVDSHVTALYNETTDTVIDYGRGIESNVKTNTNSTNSCGSTEFTISSAIDLTIQHRSQTTGTFGNAASFGIPETYLTFELMRVK